ncbi:MAG: hypothetical protein BalsKO_05290 [Balneolaceae bacterium]
MVLSLLKLLKKSITESGASESFTLPEETEYERTSSSFDRTTEPPYGTSPDVTVPDVWEENLAMG